MKNKKLAEKFLEQNGFKKTEGFAINTEEMNSEGYEEIFFEGNTLDKAIGDYVRKIKEYWIYEPSDGEQIFEDLDEAVEYVEESGQISFDDFIKAHKKLKKP